MSLQPFFWWLCACLYFLYKDGIPGHLPFGNLLFALTLYHMYVPVLIHIGLYTIFKLNLFILFIYFWLCWVFAAARGLSL